MYPVQQYINGVLIFILFLLGIYTPFTGIYVKVVSILLLAYIFTFLLLGKHKNHSGNYYFQIIGIIVLLLLSYCFKFLGISRKESMRFIHTGIVSLMFGINAIRSKIFWLKPKENFYILFFILGSMMISIGVFEILFLKYQYDVLAMIVGLIGFVGVPIYLFIFRNKLIEKQANPPSRRGD